MDLFIILSIVLPWITALVIYLAKNDFLTNILSFAMLPILGYFAWVVYSSGNLPYLMDTPSWVNYLITIYDFGLLGYFLYQGIKNKSMLVSALALLQLALLVIVVLVIEHSTTANIYVDKLTAFMYMIVAIVGVPIAIFATKYMEYNEKGKHSFVAILIWFLGVMNFAVSVNNIEWFFALFETTTLASYVLIRFRMDKQAVDNAILALWMNQIGGVAILFVGNLKSYKEFKGYSKDGWWSFVVIFHLALLVLFSIEPFIKSFLSIFTSCWLVTSITILLPFGLKSVIVNPF
jgi:ech hydrogenase subunit A